MNNTQLSRREFLRSAVGVAGLATLGGWLPAEAAVIKKAPALPVGIARCETYDLATLTPRLQALFQEIGGVKRLVSGKTVAIKPNITGGAGMSSVGKPGGRSFQTNFNVVLATVDLLHRAGARRIRIVESAWSNEPFEQYLTRAGWDLKALEATGAHLEYEDTHNRGQGKAYVRHKVPWGGYLFPSYDLNHSYSDTDLFVSIAKLKNHVDGGVTLTMKNCFGITPTSLYGSDAGRETSLGYRGPVLHFGTADPAAGIPKELSKDTPRIAPYRVPRVVADMLGIRPIDLAIIDGVESVAGGEGPWNRVQRAVTPHVMIAGRNAVCTDAIATAAMGYDPQAGYGKHPFPGANHLDLAAKVGLGSNDPKQIEVRGLSLKQATCEYG